MTEVSVLLFSK